MKRAVTCLALMLGTATPALAQADSITFGAAVQLTGNLANTGRYYRDAYQLTVDKINEKGGIKVGGKSYRLALKLLDSQSDLNLGVRQYVQLLTREKVNFLLGPYSSNDVLDTTSVSEKYQVPMVQGGGASGQIYSRGYKYVFGTLPPGEEYFGSTVEMLGKIEPKPQSVALITADDAFDVSLAKGTRKLIEQSGMKLVVDQQYGARSADFSSIIALLKSKQPDAVLWGGLEPEVLNAIRQAKGLDYSPKYFISFTVGVPTADFRKALGKDAEFAFGMTSWLPTTALKDEWFGDAEQFNKLFIEKFGYEPDYHAAAAAAAVEAYAHAIPAAGALEPAKVRDALAKVDFNSLLGHVQFDERGQIRQPQIVIQIQDGKVVPIYTTEIINKPRYPIPAWDKR